MDYVPVQMELTFSSDAQLQCTNLFVLADDIVERDEFVIALLTSSDAAVSIVQPTATVTIVDSDECKFRYYSSGLGEF